MKRREFVECVSLGGAAAMLCGGAYGRVLYQRRQFTKELMVRANPIINRKSEGELSDLPAMANRLIRTWFHAPCLNTFEFLKYISSDSFSAKLRECVSDQQRQWAFVNAFTAKVVSKSEIVLKLDRIAAKIGARLDRNWDNCCSQISQVWNTQVRVQSTAATEFDFASAVEPIIVRHFDEVLAQSHVASQRPALGKTAKEVGAAAVLLLRVSPQIGIPLFIAMAVASIYPFVLGKLNSFSSADRNAINDSLVWLASDIGSKLEKEMQTRISALHQLQYDAITKVANLYASQTVQFS